MFGKKSIWTIALALVMCMALVFTGCTQTGGTQGGGNYPGTPEAGTAVINITSEPPEMNSITTTDTVSLNVLRHLVDGLIVLDAQDKPIGGVAEKWTVSDDGLVYTFNLRKDYKWSNGEPVTAKDFDFAFKALLNPEFAADYAYFGYVFKNGAAFNSGKVKSEDVGVKVIDDYTLELTLEQPTTYLLDMLAFGAFLPVNEKAYNEFGDAYGTDADKTVTNGAFNFASWTHESEIVVTKNPDYPHAKNVSIEKIVMKMISETNVAMNSFKSGEIDMININGEQRKMMQAENQPIYNYNDASCWYLEFNTSVPAFANAKIRKALTYAVDSESFVKNVVMNDSYVLSQFTPAGINGNKKQFKDEIGPLFKSYDVAAAKKLFEEGMKEEGIDKVEVELLIDDGDTASKQAAFIQENLQKDLGEALKINIKVVTFKDRLSRLSSKEFEMALAGWGPDYNDPMTFLDMFETGNGNNHTNYSNPAYDELLNKVRQEPDRDKRFEYLMQTEKLLMEDMPIGPFYGRVRDYTLSAKLTDVVRTAFQDFNLIYAKVK